MSAIFRGMRHEEECTGNAGTLYYSPRMAPDTRLLYPDGENTFENLSVDESMYAAR